MGESFHIVQQLDPPFLFMDERVIFIPKGRQLEVNNRMIKIILVFDGVTKLSIDKQPLGEVGPGDALIVPKPCRQVYVPLANKETRLHVLRLYFDFNALSLNLLKKGDSLSEKYDLESNYTAFIRHHMRDVRLIKEAQDTFIHDCVSKIREEVELEQSGYRYQVAAHCKMLVTHLIRRVSGRATVPKPVQAKGADRTSWAVEHAKFFVCEHFNRPLTLGEIAWEVRLSAEHLARTFKQATGQTVFEYLRDIRIESAKSYLISSKRGIAEISDLVGFSSPTLFCRNFRKATGISPRAFRSRSLSQLSFQRTTLIDEDRDFLSSVSGSEINKRRKLLI